MNKFYVTVLASFLILFACTKKQPQSFTITGQTIGIKDGSKVLLINHAAAKPDTVATTQVKHGAFEFQGAILKPELASLRFENQGQNTMKFILENGQIKVYFDPATMENTQASGTELNKQYTDLILGQLKIIRQEEAFNEKARDLYQKAIEADDVPTMNALIEEKNSYLKKQHDYLQNYVQSNGDDLLSLMLLNNYSQHLGALSPIPKGIAYEIFINLSQSAKDTEIGKDLASYWRKEFKLLIGDKAPDFTIPDQDGNPVTLKDNLGKITLIDFWASWCGPCRKENPNVIKIYNKYHEKGLNIIGISIDDKADHWKAAIKQDGLPWIQVSNLKAMKDPVVVQYGIKSVPTMYILDQNGTIIARDLRGEDLEQRIAQLLE